MAYAKTTSVTPERTRAEIEQLLVRYGASGFSYAWDTDRAQVSFRTNDRFVRFHIQLPDPTDKRFSRTNHSPPRVRTPAEARKAWEQETRASWRALLLIIKAKLEAVESGIVTFDEEFLPYVLLPDGTTVGEQAIPRLIEAYDTGEMPDRLLIGAGL